MINLWEKLQRWHVFEVKLWNKEPRIEDRHSFIKERKGFTTIRHNSITALLFLIRCIRTRVIYTGGVGGKLPPKNLIKCTIKAM